MRTLLLATALVLGSAAAASAQATVVKANILSPLVRTGSFFVEHAIGEHRSVQFGALYTGWSQQHTRLSGFALTPEYRLYLSDGQPALQGFYLGPFLRYQHLTLTSPYSLVDGNGTIITDEAEAALNTFGGGLVAGHQWLFKRRFSLDAFLGPSYNDGTLYLKDSRGGDRASFNAGPFTGFGIRTGVTFGVAF